MSFEGWSPIASRYSPLKAGSIDGTDQEPHDHAIIRALNAKYRPNKGVVGNPVCTIFVAKLHPNTTEETISDTFSKYGDIKRVRLVRDIVTGYSKCYAFVEYVNQKCAFHAHRDAYKIYIDGQEIFLDFEKERTLEGWVPRRYGGGLGGKKESGQLRFGGRDRPFRKPIVMEAGTRGWHLGNTNNSSSRRFDNRDREHERWNDRYDRNGVQEKRNMHQNYTSRSNEDELEKGGKYRSRSRSTEQDQSRYKSRRSQRDYSPTVKKRTDSRRRSHSRSRDTHFKSGTSGRY